mmetsp:Transcript_78539/g.182237  ORF Transcript_78539/g.182237 Transcript_78539/m.182237 type:complete len:905 (-) Transcript_78539:150-2864(-)
MVLPSSSLNRGSATSMPSVDTRPSQRLEVPSPRPGQARVSVGSATAWQPSAESGPRQRPSSEGPSWQRPNHPGSRTQAIRQALAHSRWYRSSVATEIRTLLHGKPFALVMVVALLLALFMNDLWVLASINSNTAIDVVLSIVMFLFTLELLLLSLVDASYSLSFFQLMDVVGTISMIFDISFMVGQDATVPREASSDGDAKRNLMLLRAARAAKIGARSGRLSRVLRILRFLPFLSSGKRDESEDRGIASLISGQLANLLATRVACLTIILVMVIPLFDIWTFPQSDYSLTTWVRRLSKNDGDGRDADVAAELNLMVKFYESYSYGPYLACAGVDTLETPGFNCSSREARWSWSPTFSAPRRQASALLVHTDTFMVAFNMHGPTQLESGLAIATMCFIIVIMLFSGLTLSNVVTDLTVRPLERMLGTVRHIASTVFKFSAVVQENPNDEDVVDIDSSNEMKLLEKVVQKLAIIADLQTAKSVPQTKGDLQDEDWGILIMMHGKNIVEETSRMEGRRPSGTTPQRKKALVPTLRFEDFGVTQEVYNSWAFNPLHLTKAQRPPLAVFTISRFHDSSEGFFGTPEAVQLLQRFVGAVEKEYLSVPFHNFAHALDVVHCVARIMNLTSSERFLSELEQHSLLIAAVAHDLGHPGVNNGFLSEVRHELALQYNDRSPLENMHCAKLYTIVSKPATNVFQKLSKEQFKEVRKCCIETILHTDMMVHNSMVKDLQMVYQMNTEVFAARGDAAAGGGELAGSLAELEVFTEPEAKTLVMQCILHSADVSNPCKAWDVTHAWALVCLEEFFAQGDQEKVLGIPVQFLNDRDKLNRPNSQIGFIEFMIAPLFTAQIRLWPAMHELGKNLASNLASWADMWEKELAPSEEDIKKVRARAERVRDNIDGAVARGGS